MSHHSHPATLATASSLVDRASQPPVERNAPRLVWGRRAFAVLAWLFAGCVAAQVLFAGLATFAGPNWWSTHTSFVHLFEFLPLLMLIAAFIGALPARVKWLTLAATLLIGLQYAFIELSASLSMPELAALHPVNALLIFWLAIHLATRRR